MEGSAEKEYPQKGWKSFFSDCRCASFHVYGPPLSPLESCITSSFQGELPGFPGATPFCKTVPGKLGY